MKKDKKFEPTELELEIATIKVMIYSLYNNQKDIIKAISPSTKMQGIKEWEKACEKTAKEWLKNKNKESE